MQPEHLVPGMKGYNPSNSSRRSSSTTTMGSSSSSSNSSGTAGSTTSGTAAERTLDVVIREALAILDARRVGIWRPGDGTLHCSLDAKIWYDRTLDVHLTVNIADFMTAARGLYREGPLPTAETLLVAAMRRADYHITIQIDGDNADTNTRYRSAGGRFTATAARSTAPAQGTAAANLRDALHTMRQGDRLWDEWTAIQDEVNTIFAGLAVRPAGTRI